MQATRYLRELNPWHTEIEQISWRFKKDRGFIALYQWLNTKGNGKLIETHLEKIKVDGGVEFEPFY